MTLPVFGLRHLWKQTPLRDPQDQAHPTEVRAIHALVMSLDVAARTRIKALWPDGVSLASGNITVDDLAAIRRAVWTARFNLGSPHHFDIPETELSERGNLAICRLFHALPADLVERGLYELDEIRLTDHRSTQLGLVHLRALCFVGERIAAQRDHDNVEQLRQGQLT